MKIERNAAEKIRTECIERERSHFEKASNEIKKVENLLNEGTLTKEQLQVSCTIITDALWEGNKYAHTTSRLFNHNLTNFYPI